MQNTAVLQMYVPLVSFIASILGKHSEVVLHDLSQQETSIIAIENGHISGRKVGDAPTNLVLQVLQDKTYLKKEFIANYKAYGKNGKVFRSWSYFIKNQANELIGVLCVNSDVEHFEKAKEWIDSFLHIGEQPQEVEHTGRRDVEHLPEHLHGQAEDVLASMIHHTMMDLPTPPERMTVQEKMEIVKKLYHQGAFQLKGGVHAISKQLKSSEPTIYRYLQKIKEEEKDLF
ncbi:PAS domain-containing protein [Brevibacillus laterosporus]|uniref:helix-turn-helix transcriptional regulator n=1 Tax=Brevibacillus laterosporus TaxID=1465 RepID=UPI003D1E7F67